MFQVKIVSINNENINQVTQDQAYSFYKLDGVQEKTGASITPNCNK